VPVINIDEICAIMKPKQTLIGLDLGTKTIGIAVSDIGFNFANPRPVLKRVKFGKDAEMLLDIFQRESAGAAIIGLPLNMDGSSGARAQATRAFVRNMNALTSVPFIFWDERLSTVAAERRMIADDVSRAKRKERIDSAAAAFILQGALGRLKDIRNYGDKTAESGSV